MYEFVMQSHCRVELARRVADAVLNGKYEVLSPIKPFKRQYKHFKKRSNGTYSFDAWEDNVIYQVKMRKVD